MADYAVEELKVEEDTHHINPTADEIMDSTETKDFASGDSDDLPDHTAVMSSTAGATVGDQEDNDDEGGLFGSGSEDEGDAQSTFGTKRKLDDEELDSGDDENRNDRMEEEANGSGAEEMETQKSVQVADFSIGRHGYPRSTDGETYLLKLPHFVGLDPKAFSFHTFQPPRTDHHSQGPASSTFSAAQTARTTIRWRRSPKDPNVLQSNSRIIEWSDGSFTLQIASNPMEQYELPSKPLAPVKGTPYDARMDSHTYLASVHQATSIAQFTNHITHSLTVQTNSEQNDDALIRLQESMAAAVKGNKTTPDGGLGVINISEDPELAKKRAEQAEREKLRAQRRRQNQEEKERDRANRVLGRSGMRYGGSAAGLTVGGLEDEDGVTTARPRAKPSRKPRRRNSEYSDDEDDFRNRGRTREDEYDADDGFLVGSDEEPELVPDDSEEEEEMADDDEAEPKSKKRDSKGDKDDAAGGRTKRRRVVDDEEDD
ncbi:hypothetical protein MMC27_004405 [Xylographa pallens]|nr:hypothetical protein [Xylographa pallens]